MVKDFPRLTTFSGKQKKEQLKERKQRRVVIRNEDCGEGFEHEASPAPMEAAVPSQRVVTQPTMDKLNIYTREIVSVNQQPSRPNKGGSRANMFSLQFSKEKITAEFEKSKKTMHIEICQSDPATLEHTSDDFFPPGLAFPERPEGYRQMSKDKLEACEAKSVRLFAEEMHVLFGAADINLYEQNVETWKQLWRVMDKSDVLLFIVDMRFAVCQFPPYVYRRLSEEGRGVVLVLNKVDLVPAALVLAWQRYFAELCPDMQVVPFCSHESIVDKRRKQRLALNSCRTLVDAIEKVSKVSMSSWRSQLDRAALEQHAPLFPSTRPRQEEEEDSSDEEEELEDQDEEEDYLDALQDTSEAENSGESKIRPFTIGTIGYPNVGKSSLINAIMGKYKVSVSQNPGHTKHFQTHYVTANRDVLLCDCPGLIFPAICPYNLQVLSGTFPIAQVRGPMAVIGYMASRINVPRAISVKFPDDYRDLSDPKAPPKWTPYIVSEAWAAKRHYNIRGKGGRLDTSRAANELLRLSLAAKNKLVICLKPRGYSVNQESLRQADEIQSIRLVQGVHAEDVELQERVLSFGAIPRGTAAGASGLCGKGKKKKNRLLPAVQLRQESDDDNDAGSYQKVGGEITQISMQLKSESDVKIENDCEIRSGATMNNNPSTFTNEYDSDKEAFSAKIGKAMSKKKHKGKKK